MFNHTRYPQSQSLSVLVTVSVVLLRFFCHSTVFGLKGHRERGLLGWWMGPKA